MAGSAAIAGAAIFLSRGAARSEAQIPYPPLDVPKPLGDALWIVDSGPINAGGAKLPVRMTVIRLGDGNLLLHSPTRYTPELGRALAEFGSIRHLIAPTVAHWTFLPAWQRAFPEATVWGVPALRARPQVRRSGLRIDVDLGETAPLVWAEDVAQGLIRGGGGFEEAWLFHRPSRTLILTDLIENLDPAKLMPGTAIAMRALGMTRATTGLHVRAVLALGGAETKAAVRTMIATEPDRVIFAHGDFFTENADEQLRRAFAWLV